MVEVFIEFSVSHTGSQNYKFQRNCSVTNAQTIPLDVFFSLIMRNIKTKSLVRIKSDYFLDSLGFGFRIGEFFVLKMFSEIISKIIIDFLTKIKTGSQQRKTKYSQQNPAFLDDCFSSFLVNFSFGNWIDL